jgi:hypothetical protein
METAVQIAPEPHENVCEVVGRLSVFPQDLFQADRRVAAIAQVLLVNSMSAAVTPSKRSISKASLKSPGTAFTS